MTKSDLIDLMTRAQSTLSERDVELAVKTMLAADGRYAGSGQAH